MNEIRMKSVQSNDIAAIGYDAETETLRIEFHSGGIYEYDDFPLVEWERFEATDSYGRHFHRAIRGNYRARKVN